jgi:sugar diacid utilization regulator
MALRVQGCCELVRARKLCTMSSPAPRTPAGIDLEALDAVTDAVESGAGLPEVIRASARALDDASLALTDRSGAVLAVSARSPADERGLMGDAAGVEVHDLRVADEPVGQLRVRSRSDGDLPSPMVLRLILTLVASEVQRLRAPARASELAVAEFLHDLLGRRVVAPDEIVARAEEIGVDLSAGAAVVVVRAQLHVPTEEGWRERVVTVAERGARAAVPTAVASSSGRAGAEIVGSEVVVLVPSDDASAAEQVADSVLRELGASLPGHSFALGRSRFAADPADLPRAGNEALLAANVAEGDATGEEGPRVMAFDDTGAYRLLLSAMSEDPAELQRFYAETIEPLVAYDEQYETDLVVTVEAFLDADGNVAGTAQRLFTHRHTIRYRLERVRELSGLDVGSTDGREKLSLGLKAMRVLGIAARGGPASEQGAGGGRVPRRG